MVLVSELIREKYLFVLNGIGVYGAWDNQKRSLLERYNYTISHTKDISAFTFNCSSDDVSKHFFVEQGFLLSEGEIFHADFCDSGTLYNPKIDKPKEPSTVSELEPIINIQRGLYNELRLNKSIIFGFYFIRPGNGEIWYSITEIISTCRTLSLPIYFFNGKCFIEFSFENGIEKLGKILTPNDILKNEKT